VTGHTGPAAEPLDEAPATMERWREDSDRANAPEQRVVSLVHVGHPPAAAQFPELTEPTSTAVEPTTERLYLESGTQDSATCHDV